VQIFERVFFGVIPQDAVAVGSGLGCAKLGDLAESALSGFCSYAPKEQPFAQPWATPWGTVDASPGLIGPTDQPFSSRTRGTVGPLGRLRVRHPPDPQGVAQGWANGCPVGAKGTKTASMICHKIVDFCAAQPGANGDGGFVGNPQLRAKRSWLRLRRARLKHKLRILPALLYPRNCGLCAVLSY
jgi:hypothetical protein